MVLLFLKQQIPFKSFISQTETGAIFYSCFCCCGFWFYVSTFPTTPPKKKAAAAIKFQQQKYLATNEKNGETNNKSKAIKNAANTAKM